MDLAEDLSVYLADFGQACTLAGASVRAIVDTESALQLDVLTEGPSALLSSTDAASAAPAQAFVAGGVSYTVRQVSKEPPDGAFTRLVLARS
jgi:hypothetical protein